MRNAAITAEKSVDIQFGPRSRWLECPYCHKSVQTQVKYRPTTKAHVAASLLCFIGCCWLPYMLRRFTTLSHYCPACGQYLGSYGRVYESPLQSKDTIQIFNSLKTPPTPLLHPSFSKKAQLWALDSKNQIYRMTSQNFPSRRSSKTKRKRKQNRNYFYLHQPSISSKGSVRSNHKDETRTEKIPIHPDNQVNIPKDSIQQLIENLCKAQENHIGKNGKPLSRTQIKRILQDAIDPKPLENKLAQTSEILAKPSGMKPTLTDKEIKMIQELTEQMSRNGSPRPLNSIKNPGNESSPSAYQIYERSSPKTPEAHYPGYGQILGSNGFYERHRHSPGIGNLDSFNIESLRPTTPVYYQQRMHQLQENPNMSYPRKTHGNQEPYWDEVVKNSSFHPGTYQTYSPEPYTYNHILQPSPPESTHYPQFNYYQHPEVNLSNPNWNQNESIQATPNTCTVAVGQSFISPPADSPTVSSISPQPEPMTVQVAVLPQSAPKITEPLKPVSKPLSPIISLVESQPEREIILEARSFQTSNHNITMVDEGTGPISVSSDRHRKFIKYAPSQRKHKIRRRRLDISSSTQFSSRQHIDDIIQKRKLHFVPKSETRIVKEIMEEVVAIDPMVLKEFGGIDPLQHKIKNRLRYFTNKSSSSEVLVTRRIRNLEVETDTDVPVAPTRRYRKYRKNPGSEVEQCERMLYKSRLRKLPEPQADFSRVSLIDSVTALIDEMVHDVFFKRNNLFEVFSEDEMLRIIWRELRLDSRFVKKTGMISSERIEKMLREKIRTLMKLKEKAVRDMERKVNEAITSKVQSVNVRSVTGLSTTTINVQPSTINPAPESQPTEKKTRTIRKKSSSILRSRQESRSSDSKSKTDTQWISKMFSNNLKQFYNNAQSSPKPSMKSKLSDSKPSTKISFREPSAQSFSKVISNEEPSKVFTPLGVVRKPRDPSKHFYSQFQGKDDFFRLQTSKDLSVSSQDDGSHSSKNWGSKTKSKLEQMQKDIIKYLIQGNPCQKKPRAKHIIRTSSGGESKRNNQVASGSRPNFIFNPGMDPSLRLSMLNVKSSSSESRLNKKRAPRISDPMEMTRFLPIVPTHDVKDTEIQTQLL